MKISDIVLNEIRLVAEEQSIVLGPLTDCLRLVETGLDSLSFAILVARLEEATGRDPLGEDASQPFPRTIGEFIALYEQIAV